MAAAMLFCYTPFLSQSHIIMKSKKVGETMKTNDITTGGILAGAAALFQVVPIFLSEIFVFVTMLSALPIYFAAKKNERMGCVAYFCTILLVGIFSTHEAMFFAFSNGVIGLSLGLASHRTSKKSVIVSFGALALTCSLCIINFLLGIPVFGTQVPGSITYQIIFIFIFCLIYNIFFFFSADYLFKFLIRTSN